MSTSEVVSQTIQATALGIVSNVLAQVISSYRHNTPLSLDFAPVLKFAFFSVLSTPPNVVWQFFLENTFPTYPPSAPSEKANGKPSPKRSTTEPHYPNVLKKLLLDQTLSAGANTFLFLAYMAFFNNSDPSSAIVLQETKQKFWPLMKDGYKLWPWFALVSFLWIPVDKRMLAGCAVGMGWNIYLSMLVGK